MIEHAAASVPAVPGIDLSFRPRTYFGPLPLKTHLLAHVTGQERRELLRGLIAAEGAEQIAPDLAVSTLDEEARRGIGRIHPAFMGGEYLPPLDPHEIEIARISLESVTADQISVRAKADPAGISYRIVDEYGDCSFIAYHCQVRNTPSPLTLAELVAMLDGACEQGGAVMSHIIGSMATGEVYPDDVRNFVSVSSEFYPQLHDYYATRIEDWFDEHYPPVDTEAEEEREREEEQRRAVALAPLVPQIEQLVSAWKSENPAHSYAGGIGKAMRAKRLRAALEEFALEHGHLSTGKLTVNRTDGPADTFHIDALRSLVKPIEMDPPCVMRFETEFGPNKRSPRS